MILEINSQYDATQTVEAIAEGSGKTCCKKLNRVQLYFTMICDVCCCVQGRSPNRQTCQKGRWQCWDGPGLPGGGVSKMDAVQTMCHLGQWLPLSSWRAGQTQEHIQRCRPPQEVFLAFGHQTFHLTLRVSGPLDLFLSVNRHNSIIHV